MAGFGGSLIGQTMFCGPLIQFFRFANTISRRASQSQGGAPWQKSVITTMVI